MCIGLTYLWQITIDCKGGSIVKRAEFEVINPQSVAKKKFRTIPESVDYYAQKELWYEALEAALKTQDDGKLSQTGSELVKDLSHSEIFLESNSEIHIKEIKRRIGHLEIISQESL